MAFPFKIQDYFLKSTFFQWLNKVSIPGVKGVSLFELLYIYISGIIKGTLTLRAAAISWSVFFSIFPFVIFLFTFFPHLPHYQQVEQYFFLDVLPKVLPEPILKDATAYISETLNSNKFTVWSWSVYVSIFFSTSGINALINGFNFSYRKPFQKRKGFQQYLLAFGYTLLFTLFLFGIVLSLYYSQFIWKFIDNQTLSGFRILFSKIGSLLLGVLMFMVGVLLLYKAGPRFGTSNRSLLPGVVLSTLLFVLTSSIFGYYITHFTRYNLLYGSISTVMILMIWIYVNVIIVLVGFELNVALHFLSETTPSQRQDIFSFLPLDLEELNDQGEET
ncbi:MAG: hypothetical protein C4K58_03125 [Flavobacteriaceae bacterium]|nr:MAG: hypothetical protein C4K58_03125 [Flavobacteriaceae bacterium]